jgi:hypothetical protein
MEELEQFFEGPKEDLDEMQLGIEEERQAASKWQADYASVAVDDAECTQCGGNRKPVGVCRFTWVSISHCFPRSAFVAAQSASGRRELLEAQCLVICVGLLIPLCDAIRTRESI